MQPGCYGCFSVRYQVISIDQERSLNEDKDNGQVFFHNPVGRHIVRCIRMMDTDVTRLRQIF